MLREYRASGIGFRLEAQHAPDVAALRISQVPPDHFGDIIDVAARDRKTECILQEQPGLLSNLEAQDR